jgi:starvation-inducible DNA-binding protein
MTADFHIPLAADQQAVATELQSALVDLLDMALIGKHLDWNVEGRHLRSLHHDLDEQVAAWRRLSDDVAERAVTIGASPDGQAETIAGATQLEPLPTGHLTDQQVLKAIGDRVSAVALRARQRIDRVAVTDPVTCDLFVQVLATLEKQQRMIRAQTGASGRAGAETLGIRPQAANGDDVHPCSPDACQAHGRPPDQTDPPIKGHGTSHFTAAIDRSPEDSKAERRLGGLDLLLLALIALGVGITIAMAIIDPGV